MVNRELRLRREYEVARARREGKAYADGPLAVRILPTGGDPPANRYAVIAGKRVGKAHDRNRCKRLAREAIRYLHPHLHQGYDVAVIVRGNPDELFGLTVAYGSLERIFRRAKLLAEEPVLPPLPKKAEVSVISPPPDHPDA
jgi:ribonuclease P protein component